MRRNSILFAVTLLAAVVMAGSAQAAVVVSGQVNATDGEGPPPNYVTLWLDEDPSDYVTDPVDDGSGLPNQLDYWYYSDLSPLLTRHGYSHGATDIPVTIVMNCSGTERTILEVLGDPYSNKYRNDSVHVLVDFPASGGVYEAPLMELDICPDLIVKSITPNCGGYLFGNQSNDISAKIENIGPGAAGASDACFATSGGFSGSVSVPALAPGENTTVTINDPTIRSLGDPVTITVTADCNGVVREQNETNNQSTSVKTVVNNGYKGKTYTGGPNMTTWQEHDITGNLVYSVGTSYYMGCSDKPKYEWCGDSNWTTYNVSWTACDNMLPIPETATVIKARLYATYTWDKKGVMDNYVSVDFNGVTQTLDKHYKDSKAFTTYKYPYGMLAYNVTGDFDVDGNYANLTNSYPGGDNVSMRGMLLVVVYEDPTEPRRQIFINEEFDLLYGGSYMCTTPAEATSYAPITGVDMTDMTTARLIAVAPGAGSYEDNIYDPTEGELIFNGHVWTDAWDYVGDHSLDPKYCKCQIGIRDVTVTPYLAVDNLVEFQSSGDWMEASNAFLVVTHGEAGGECLGTCYEDAGCTADPVPDMTCAACIAAGKFWHPNLDKNCFDSGTPEDLCIDWCPECCDCVDNLDEDTDVDYPADLQCSCGLDPSEDEPSCPIPEVPCLVTMAIGLVALVGLIRYRREG